MPKELKTIDLNILPIETLKEMANDTAEQVENNAKLTVQKAIDCGRYLTAIKEQLVHGQWGGWLGANWNYSQKTAAQYMQISNFTCGLNLKDAASVNEALRMIADSKPETAPRAERKPATVVVTTPVDEPEQDEPEVDDDPTPEPPTIRKIAKGSEKVSEDKKPRTAAITPEILLDEPTPAVRTEEIINAFVIQCEVEQFLELKAKAGTVWNAKAEAKMLRKLADKLDPPTKFTKPDLEDVSAYLTELKAVEPESFFDFYESKGWLVGKVSMKDWRASARKWVRENHANGKGNSNGRRTAENQDPASCLGANGRPRVERAKITYK
jgi:hypothetical protein